MRLMLHVDIDTIQIVENNLQSKEKEAVIMKGVSKQCFGPSFIIEARSLPELVASYTHNLSS